MIVIDLPFPPAALSPNKREKWEKIVAIKAYRNAVGQLAKSVRNQAPALFPLKAPVQMRVVFMLSDRRRRDADNLIARFKAGQDGLVDAGILADDDIRSLLPSYAFEDAKEAAVRVELEGVR